MRGGGVVDFVGPAVNSLRMGGYGKLGGQLYKNLFNRYYLHLVYYCEE